MKKYFEVLFGLLIITIVLYVSLSFPTIYYSALTCLKGGIAWFLLAIGAGLVLLGLSEFKN